MISRQIASRTRAPLSLTIPESRRAASVVAARRTRARGSATSDPQYSLAIIPIRSVKNAFVLPLKSELTRIVVKTWKPGIAPPDGPDRSGHDRLNHLMQLEIVELAGQQRRGRHVGVKMGQVSAATAADSKVGRSSRPCAIERQDQKRIEPPALRNGRRQEHRRRHLLDQGVGFRVQNADRILDLPAIDRLAGLELKPWVARQSLAQSLEVLLEFGARSRSPAATSGFGMRMIMTTGTPMIPP